ncbi:hypothetical protein Q3G72_014400 [Acer saccharum]|nr:hypothetical protein Q3G72_014400 [Acer saccharum]
MQPRSVAYSSSQIAWCWIHRMHLYQALLCHFSSIILLCWSSMVRCGGGGGGLVLGGGVVFCGVDDGGWVLGLGVVVVVWFWVVV